MAVGTLEAQIGHVNERVSELREETHRRHESLREDLYRERGRVDDLETTQSDLAIATARLSTTIKIAGAIITLTIPMLVGLAVWLVLRTFDPSPSPAHRVTTMPLPASATAMMPVMQGVPR